MSLKKISSEDELSMLSIRFNQLWKKRQKKFRGYKRIGGQSESTYGKNKSGAGKDVTCFKCKHLRHYKNEYPKLMPKRKFFKEKKKVLMAVWNNSEASEDDSKEE